MPLPNTPTPRFGASAQDPDRLLLVGRVQKAHGVQGELKVFPETDEPGRLVDLERVYLGASPEAAREAEIVSVRAQYPKGRVIVLLTLAGVKSREEADVLRGAGVYAHEDDLPPLEEGEVFLHDLVGLQAFARYEEDGELVEVGTVKEVLEGGAQLLFVIAQPGRPDAMIPDVDAFVESVDVEAGRVVFTPPDGLLDFGNAASERDADGPDEPENDGSNRGA
jgi:16S rRNA processing protein RimM